MTPTALVDADADADDLAELGRELAAMSASALAAYLADCSPADLDVVEVAFARAEGEADAALPVAPVDAFARLGYEPNCLPRIAAADRAGYQRVLDAVVAGTALPAPCGRCPQELFHSAVEDDVLYGGAAGGGKLLSLDTPIPTPRGWVTMRDIRSGDRVFTETGEVCRVIHAHPVDVRPECYRMTFDDGSTIDAGAEHLWLTYTAADLAALSQRDSVWRARRRASRPSRATGLRSETFTAAITARNRRLPPPALAKPTGAVRSTAAIAATLRLPSGRANHAVPVAGGIDLPEVDLALDPYLLGVWLGDGSTRAGSVTSADPEVQQAFVDAGFVIGTVHQQPGNASSTFTVRGLVTVLRKLGIYGDKHVPAEYLRASAKQRLALLQGLMDTDGTATKSGSAEFCSTRLPLADAVRELACSLGHKVGPPRQGRARLYGVDCGPKWTVKWTAPEPVFRLARKLERQRLQGQRRTNRFRYIVGCEHIPSLPMRCITVDNPEGLYLAGQGFIPTHNTKALLMEGIRACVDHPGIWVGAYRRTYDELAESLLKELQRIDYAVALGATWNKGDKELTFPGRATRTSKMRFRYAETVDDAIRRQGGDYQLLLVDERTLMPAGVVAVLQERLRSADPAIPVLGTRSSANPGGPSHGEVKAAYVEATGHGARVVTDAFGRTQRFIPARLADNPYLERDESYRRTLEAIPDPARRKAMKDGNWDVFAGQVFSEWDRDRHVLEPVHLPAAWPRYAGIDYGYRHPYAVVWGAVDNDRRVWIYREICESGVGQSAQARAILAAEGDEAITRRFIDPSMEARTGEANSNADIYRQNGVAVTRADNDRLSGWARVHDFLADGPACDVHRARGWATCPLLHVFANCPELARTLPALPYDRHRTEDVDTNTDDHLSDALRYLLRGIAPKARERQTTYTDLRGRR